MGRYEEKLGRYIHMMKSSVEVTKRWVFDEEDACRYNVMSSIDVEQRGVDMKKNHEEWLGSKI